MPGQGPSSSGGSGGGGGIGGGGGQGRRLVPSGFNVDHAPGGGGFGGGGGGEFGNSSGDVNGADGGFGGGGGYGVISGLGGFGAGNGNSNPFVGGGGAGMGGAIFNHTGTLTCLNSTLSGNSATGGSSGTSAGGGGGGSGLGGAVFNLDGVVSLTHCTLAGNEIQAGVGGTDGTAAGGAIYNRRQDPGLTGYGFTYPDASITVGGSILADSVDGDSNPIADCAFSAGVGDPTLANVTTAGNNVTEDRADCALDGGGDLYTLDAELGPLADNGGPTPTHLPARHLAGDRRRRRLLPTVDQRGISATHRRRPDRCRDVRRRRGRTDPGSRLLHPDAVSRYRHPRRLPLAAGIEREFAVAGTCGVPSGTVAVALNLTVVGSGQPGPADACDERHAAGSHRLFRRADPLEQLLGAALGTGSMRGHAPLNRPGRST